ncbi:MAG: chondroitinase-B domain-containing protein, partial [Ilumatobacteraceae bacterium]
MPSAEDTPRGVTDGASSIPTSDDTFPETTRTGSTEVVVGADNTLQRLPSVPVDASGQRNLQPGNSVGEVQQAISSASPGDVVTIADGTYRGNLAFNSSGGTATQIVIRPANEGKAVWEDGSFEITGSHIIIVGLTITSDNANFLRISEQARDIRISSFTFDNVGSGDDGSSTGIIRIESDPSSPPGIPTQNSPPVAIDRHIFIDGNTFNRPRNTVLWVNHGNRGINFVHNKIHGPHEISGGETEALKFGYGTGLFEQADSRIAFNTITDWSGLPYVIGIKMSGVAIVANLIGQGRVE